MLIYNVTTKVHNAIAGDWLQWLKQEHIPEIITTCCFTHAIVLRFMEIDDDEGPTYTVQYFANTQQDYDHYVEDHASSMRNKAFEKWGNQFIAFRSLMHIVQ